MLLEEKNGNPKLIKALPKLSRSRPESLNSIGLPSFHYVIQPGEDEETNYGVQKNMSPKFQFLSWKENSVASNLFLCDR